MAGLRHATRRQELQGEIEISGELQHFGVPMPGFRIALGDIEIASSPSYIRKSWTDAEADVMAEVVLEVING